MKKYTIVGFNENGKSKFPHLKDCAFLFLTEIPNNSNWVIVRGFRGKFAFGSEFIENIDDIRELTSEEVDKLFNSTTV